MENNIAFKTKIDRKVTGGLQGLDTPDDTV